MGGYRRLTGRVPRLRRDSCARSADRRRYMRVRMTPGAFTSACGNQGFCARPPKRRAPPPCGHSATRRYWHARSTWAYQLHARPARCDVSRETSRELIPVGLRLLPRVGNQIVRYSGVPCTPRSSTASGRGPRARQAALFRPQEDQCTSEKRSTASAERLCHTHCLPIPEWRATARAPSALSPLPRRCWSPAQITPPLEAGEPLPPVSFTVVPSRRARSYSWAQPDRREAALHVVKGRSCCLSSRPAKHDRRHVSRETYPAPSARSDQVGRG